MERARGWIKRARSTVPRFNGWAERRRAAPYGVSSACAPSEAWCGGAEMKRTALTRQATIGPMKWTHDGRLPTATAGPRHIAQLRPGA
eukprot:6172405-Pleurochrysis_carterae.AAC.3